MDDENLLENEAPAITEAPAGIGDNRPPPGPLPMGFDYERLEQPIADVLRENTTAIHSNLRTLTEAAHDTGRRLTAVKDLLRANGEMFGDWLKHEFGWSWDTANRYMSVYRQLGEERFRKLRNHVKNATTLYKLAAKSTPEHVRLELADEFNAGDPVLDDEILRRIDEAKSDGVTVIAPSKQRQRETRRREYAIAAVKLARQKMGNDFHRFVELYNRSGNKFSEVANARPLSYVIGLMTGNLIDLSTNLPLTDDQLHDSQLYQASKPQ
jgi:hypothetical protein